MQDTLRALTELEPAGGTIGMLAIVMVALAVYDPLAGRHQHRRFMAALGRDEPGVRTRFYRSWIVQGVAAAAVAVLLAALLPGVGLAALGLQLPDLSAVERFLQPSAGMAVGILVGLTLAVLIFRAVRRSGPPDGSQLAGAEALLPMLPRTSGERRWWAGLSLSAGVTEEITYRGLLVLTLALLWPDVPVIAALLVSGVVFGLAHWYQGGPGMLATGALGVAFTGLYLATGSLLLPIVLHILVDLRALGIRQPVRGAAAAPAPAAAGDDAVRTAQP